MRVPAAWEFASAPVAFERGASGAAESGALTATFAYFAVTRHSTPWQRRGRGPPSAGPWVLVFLERMIR